MELKIGQRVVLPRIQGGMDITKERPGTVVEEYGHFYTVQTDIGYMESVPKHGEGTVRLIGAGKPAVATMGKAVVRG